MRANEAPEKIYLFENPISGTPDDRWLSKRSDENDIEYIRFDTFIEKACRWLKNNADNYTWYDEMEGESGMTDEFVDEFANYMKGE